MKKRAAKFKVPDVEKDRKILVEELRRDFQDLLDDPLTGDPGRHLGVKVSGSRSSRGRASIRDLLWLIDFGRRPAISSFRDGGYRF
jgi:hypothetical protein